MKRKLTIEIDAEGMSKVLELQTVLNRMFEVAALGHTPEESLIHQFTHTVCGCSATVTSTSITTPKGK